MKNSYLELHLENTEISSDYMEQVKADLWENDEYISFNLTIEEITRGICYAFDLYPFDDESEDMEELSEALEAKGFEVNGYGWEDYLCEYIEKNYPDFLDKVNTDSESDTCGIYVMDSLEDYKKLLCYVSEAVRALLA
ncbi:Imm51 family immunity protein [Sebaldella sp. S0638]|uniref:Imm51 family immunity protein n=1 Tax=Sebaldella sp. S0638 TaxID=2957809 RepID=UPI00209D3A5F|nr:Imm51 family immunity protein [Sebaldella sp. S0638]MCP1223097.1 immunity 51 family protein [Sebaldella sp. S0638]